MGNESDDTQLSQVSQVSQADALSKALDEVNAAATTAYVEAFGEAALRQRTYLFEDVYMARRALPLGVLFDKDTEADGWVARIDGTNPYYRLERRFLPHTRHVLGQARRAIDFSAVRTGNFLQCHLDSRRVGVDLFVRVVFCTDGQLTIEPLTEREVAALYHGDLR